MGNLGDGDSKSKPTEDSWIYSFNLTDTQPFDSQDFRVSSPGEKEEVDYHMQNLQSNVLLDDTVPVEDAFDTQVLDIGGETQMLDFPDCFEHMDTQLIEEFKSDGEGSDTTEVMDGSEELLDVDTCRRANSESSDVEISTDTSFAHEKNKPAEEGGKICCFSSGQRFTALRAASFRASGIAARKVALDKTNSGITGQQNSEMQVLGSNVSNTKAFEEADRVCDTGRHNDAMKELINGNTAKMTARKLFAGDCFVETEVLPSVDDNNIEGNEMLQMAGLSYIDSQEPGESTQENALACVDRLIEESRVLLDDYDLGYSSKGKSNLSSTAKGAVSLAKKNNQIGTYVKSAIFDWDDGQEDEGGGDIFRRRKDEFLGSKSVSGKPHTKRRKAFGNQPDGCADRKEILNIQDLKISVNGLELNDKTASETEMTVTKNLVDEFDEEYNRTSSAGQLEAVEEVTAGLDTQMAAEAMEALVYGDGIANSDADFVAGNTEATKNGSTGTKAKSSSQKKRPLIEDGDIGVTTGKSRRKLVGKMPRKQLLINNRRQSQIVKLCTNGVMTRRKKTKADAENRGIKTADKLPAKKAGLVESHILGEVGRHEGTSLSGTSLKNQNLPEEFAACTPVAYRTRRASVSKSKGAESMQNGCAEELNLVVQVDSCKNNKAGLGIEAAKMLDTKWKSSDLFSIETQDLEILKSKSTTINDGISCPKRRRSIRKLSGPCNKSDNLDAQSKPSDQLGNMEKSASMHTRSHKNAQIAGDLNKKRCTRTIGKSGASKESGIKVSREQPPDKMTDVSLSSSAKHELKATTVILPQKATEPSKSTCTTPVECSTPVNSASPVIGGDEYSKRTCKRSLSNSIVMKEISSLYDTRQTPFASPRKKRDLGAVRILFSQHLDDDIIKQQAKIAERLKISIAASITDATHFIADNFLRTRNMLEAIASGKPVVTHLWLEDVGLANYYIDEQKYIVRDTKKEKELGFNMQVSLACASQHPLLQGRKVLITPNSKPSKEIIAGLVKTVCGQAIERVGRSTLKDETIPDDLLILSCEEDYEVCVPFLKKGAAVYSSELLLNGIVTQKLEYARFELFADNVKKTRSTIWLKKAGDGFTPVTKQR